MGLVNKFFTIFGKLVVILLGAGILIGVGMYVGRRNNPQVSSSLAPTPTAVVTQAMISTAQTVSLPVSPTVTSTKTISGGVKTMTLYTISIPNDWQATPSQHDEAVGIDKLVVAKDGYELTVYQAPMGGGLCLYPGDKPFEGPSQKYVSFVEIQAGDGKVYRRSATADVTGSKKTYTICQKAPDGSFGSITTYGAVTYSVPTTPTETILTQMDSIIATLKKQ